MSVETLLTLAVAAGILILAAVLRLLVLGTIKLVRVIAGRPQRRLQRPLAEAIAPRPVLRERGKRLLDGVVALVAFLGASLSNWWREAARPSLAEAQEAGLAAMTERPEASGRLEVLERLTPVLGNGVAVEEERPADMQLV